MMMMMGQKGLWPCVAVLLVLLLTIPGRGRAEPRVNQNNQNQSWPCSWPILAQDKFPQETVNVMSIQEFLNTRTGSGLLVTGQFNSFTTAAVKNFQLSVGLTNDGLVGSSTWQQLVLSIPGDRGVNAHGGGVRALQQQLTYWGYYSGKITGEWDAVTQAATLAFQVNRTMAVDPSAAPSVDMGTWHLLISGCQASVGSAAYGIDIGWPEGDVSTAQFSCLQQMGFQFLIQEAYTESRGFWQPAVSNAKNAMAAGFSQIEYYHFFNQSQDPSTQIATTIKGLQANNLTVARLWVDIEGSWPGSPQFNQQFLSAAISAIRSFGVLPGIYCGREWPQIFGANFTAFSDVPLWTALFDNIPSQRFYWDNPWGGWQAPTIKQFSADGSSSQLAPSHCNVTIDWDFLPYSEQAHFPVKSIYPIKT